MSPEFGSKWRNFPLEKPRDRSLGRDISSSHYKLDVLEKSFKGQNALRIATDPKVRRAYLEFLDRLYYSEESYYLTTALLEPFQNGDETVRNFGEDAFYHIMETLGFNKHDTSIMVEKWILGMEKIPVRGTYGYIERGIERHMESIIELERYKRGAFHTLFKEFGLANACRYNGRALKYQYEFRDSDLPYIQVINAASDHNGSQLTTSILADLAIDITGGSNQRETMRRTLRAIEVWGHENLVAKKRFLLNRYGPGKVMAYFLFGHGDGKRINLGGNQWSSRENLTIEDIIKLDVFGQKTGEHMGHPTIIFSSCSAGQMFAKRISEHYQALVFAPLAPARILRIDLDRETGFIERVAYSSASIIFDNGRIVQTMGIEVPSNPSLPNKGQKHQL